MASPQRRRSSMSGLSMAYESDADTLTPDTASDAESLLDQPSNVGSLQDSWAAFEELRYHCSDLLYINQQLDSIKSDKASGWQSLLETKLRQRNCIFAEMHSCTSRLSETMQSLPLVTQVVKMLGDTRWKTAEPQPSEDLSQRGFGFMAEQERAELLILTGLPILNADKVLSKVQDLYLEMGSRAIDSVHKRLKAELIEDSGYPDCDTGYKRIKDILGIQHDQITDGYRALVEKAATEARDSLNQLSKQQDKRATTLLDSLGVSVRYTADLAAKLWSQWQRKMASRGGRLNLPPVTPSERERGSAEHHTVIHSKMKRDPITTSPHGDQFRLAAVAAGEASVSEAFAGSIGL